ncbi:MFS transporter-like protein Fmp42 [Xylogone sp. PMI_703]|nr:MFS transporter-like protein Fmp42 [Xylogone sp. PMI_703]
MSLLERVTSFETFTPERGRSPADPARHKLTFNPLPETLVVEPVEAIGAFEVSKAQRIIQVALAVIYCLASAGIVFGYAALKPILIHEEVYRDFCTEDELDQDVRVCFQQEIHLNLMFTVAAVATNVAALPIGSILDNFGPRVCGIIGSFSLTAGALLFAFAKQIPVDGYLFGYLFLALGGPFIYISSFHLSNAFPKHSGFILALITGAFDSSSAVFLGYRYIYQSSDQDFDPKRFFLAYLVVPVFIFLVQILVMPKQSYKSVGELVTEVEEASEPMADQVNENTALLWEERNRRESVVNEITELIGSKSGGKQIRQEEDKGKVSGVWGAMHGKTAKQQILSPWWVLIALFTVIQMTRINFFVATIRSQYEYLFHSHSKAVALNTFFDVALPVGGLIAIPFIGVILDHTSTVSVLTLLVTIATSIGVLGILPYTWAAYANVSLFVLYRPFYYTAVSDYSAKVFGFRTFGTVYGCIICFAGLFNFSQSGLDALMHTTFHGNPVPVNIILTGTALFIGLILVSYVGVRAYYIKRELLVEEAERAQETPMPGAQMP